MNEYTEDIYTYPNDVLSKSYDEISSVMKKFISDERYRKIRTCIHSHNGKIYTQSCDVV